MKRIAALLLTPFLLFSFASCDQANISDEITPSTPFDTADSSTEYDNVESDDKIDSNDSLDQVIFDSVSPLIDHDTLYNEEFPRRYNFISDTTGYFFQFRFFGSENRLVYLLKTKDGGKTWVAQDIQIPSSMGWREHVICAKMLDENVGLISGMYGPSENFSDRTYITADGGKTWSKIVLPKDAPGIISERSNDLATYSECEAYDLTHENGVYFLCVRDAYYNPESDNSTYNYFRFSSTDLVSWTFVEPDNETETKTELSEKYPDIPKALESILNAYIGIAYLNRYEGYHSREKIEDAKYPGVTSDQLDCIFNSLMDGWRNGGYGYYAGYAVKDINGDGINELFLTDVEYSIYAMFTLANSEIISHYFDFSFHKSVTRIDKNGNFYYSDYGKGESIQYEISRLGTDGKLYRTVFGHYDMTGFGDPEVYNYFSASEIEISDSLIDFSSIDSDKLTDEEYNGIFTAYKISNEEYNSLVSAYREAIEKLKVFGYDPNEEAIKAIGLEFYQVIVEDLRK